MVARGEVPGVRWEAGNGGVRALRLGGGGQEAGGRAGKVNSQRAGGVGAGWEERGPGVWERWESPGAGVAALGEEGGVRAAFGHLSGLPGLLRTLGKWCPAWGGLEDPVPPTGSVLAVWTPVWETSRPGERAHARAVRAAGCALGGNVEG